MELARALSNDPDLIYDFVRNNVSTEWAYGARKGEVGAIIDKSGTAFDQARLMVELLRQSGYTAAYKVGTITLTGAQFLSWSGIESAAAACQLLSSGSIPAVINGATPPANCAFSGNVSSIQLGHVWVTATIGGTAYVFDPAYKPYTTRPGVNLASVAGLTSGQPLAQSQTGVETGSASGAPYVRSVGSENLNSTVQAYSNNLQAYIDANVAAGQLEDLIGGRDIVRYEAPAGGLRQTTLPYTSSVLRTYAGELPDRYRTSLRVQITKEQSGGGYASIADKTLYVDEIYGRKLNFQTINSGSDVFTGSLVLREDSGAVISLTSYTDQTNMGYANGTVTLTANLPYAASSGAYMDFTTQRTVAYVFPLTIVHNWGDMGRGLMDKWGSRIDTIHPRQPYLYACDHCVSYYNESTGDGRREQVAGSWPTQASRAARIHAEIAKSIYTQHYAIGLVSADTEVRVEVEDPYIPSYRYLVSESYDVIDVESGISVTSRTADATARRAAIHAIVTTMAALEGSVFAQIADLPDTSSTATRFEWGNRPPAGEDAGSNNYGPRRFYEFTSVTEAAAVDLVKVEGKTAGASDWTADGFHSRSTPELGRSEITGRRIKLSNAISKYAEAGYTVVASEDGFLGPGQLAGAFFQPSGTTQYQHESTEQRGGALVATRYVNGDPVEIAHAIVNPARVAKGGGGGAQTYHSYQYDPSVAADVLKARFVDRSNVVGVDLKDGSATYVSPASLSVGAGEFPYRLDAKLIWRGGNAISSAFGPANHAQPTAPWTTNWNNTLTMSSSAMEAMGDTDIRAASGTVAAFLAMQDIYKAAPALQREVAGVLVGAWWVRQITGNVVTVGVGADTRQFLKRANGAWFAPGPGAVGALTQTGSRLAFAEPSCSPNGLYTPTRGWNYSGMSFQVTGPNGDVQNFSNWKKSLHDGTGAWCAVQRGFRLTSWTWPQGVSVNLTYVSPTQPNRLDELSEVSNSLGQKIKFVNSGLGGFNNGLTGADLRSVTVSGGHVDAESNLTKFSSGTFGGRYILKEVWTPDAPTTASLRYVYDLNGRIKEAWDANALRLGSYPHHQFFIAEGVRSSRLDPHGGRYSVLYDAEGRPFRFIDELGRTTSAAYDGRGRVLSYTYPEGDQETFAYDARNNTTQLTKTAKPGSPLAPISISATWHATWNKPTSITDPRGYVTDFTYFASGAGKSLMATAARPDPDGTGPLARPVYSFTYNALGQPLTVTDPTGVVTQNVYNLQGYVGSTAVDPTGVNAVTAFTYNAQGDVSVTDGPRTDVTDVSYALYDAMRRKVMEIGPDPDGAGALLRPATRTTYDAEGQVTQVERGRTTSIAGTDFVALATTGYAYDPVGNKVREHTQAGLTQHEYDGLGRVTCTAVRMNAALFTTPPASACLAGAPGAFGPDRIGRKVYDLAGQLLRETRGEMTSLVQDYATYTYTANGQKASVRDANGNLSAYEYDGFDRLAKLRFPSTTRGSGQASATDFEAYDYDAAGNRTGV
ncbi:MAG TPA: hypothetical protein VD906_08940, partial [Caulobacteraceae bacterium]|nr:hypothetical protein [Caulobacteraceae bacterium]